MGLSTPPLWRGGWEGSSSFEMVSRFVRDSSYMSPNCLLITVQRYEIKQYFFQSGTNVEMQHFAKR